MESYATKATGTWVREVQGEDKGVGTRQAGDWVGNALSAGTQPKGKPGRKTMCVLFKRRKKKTFLVFVPHAGEQGKKWKTP